MDSISPTRAGSPPVSQLTRTGLPDLRAEVLGTLLLFLFTVLVTAGVALCAHVLVRAVG